MGTRSAWPLLALVAITLTAPPLVEAQGGRVEAGVDELVARAIADHPDLRAARAEVDAAAARVRQAALRPNPMLDLGGQKALGTDNNLNVGLTVPLDLNGRQPARVGVAEREVDMKRAQVADRERRLAGDIRLKAGEVLAARRNLGFTDELLAVNREGLRIVQDRVRLGRIPPLEESMLLVEVNRLDATRELLASRVEIATLQLKALAGLPPDAPLILQGDLAATTLPIDRVAAVQQAIDGRADIAMSRADIEMARARIRKEEAEGRWDASANVGYMRQDFGYGGLSGLTATGATRPIQDVFHYFGGGVTVTLPVRNRNQGSVAAAIAETRAAERRQEFLRLMIGQEVQSAFAQHEGARRSVEIYGRGVREVARRNLEVVRQTYQLGRSSLLDVVAEQRRYIDIETGYTEALRQLYDAAVEVRRAIGLAER
jgi:cobalt-zinc-cadmium efflux system outer membrane protein